MLTEAGLLFDHEKERVRLAEEKRQREEEEKRQREQREKETAANPLFRTQLTLCEEVSHNSVLYIQMCCPLYIQCIY